MTARRTTTATRLASSVVVGVLLGVPVALLLGLLAPGTAQATTYRYWTYWWGRPGKPGWTFASQGPASDVPGDQWVLGWRFGETSVNGGGGQPPRASNAYSALCPTAAAAPAGQRRVAVVVDYGTADVAPPGETPPGGGTARVECVTIPDLAHGFDAMRAAAITVRQGADGFVCGIDGYPRTECSAAVSTPAPAPSTPAATPRPSSAAPSSPGAAISARAPASSTAPVRASAAASTRPSTGGAVPVAATSGTAAGSPGSSSASATDPSATDEPPADAVPEATLRAVSGAPASSTASSGSPLGFLVGVVILGAAASTTWLVSKRRRGDRP